MAPTVTFSAISRAARVRRAGGFPLGLLCVLGAGITVPALAAGPQAGAPARARLVVPASKLPDHEEFEATLQVPFTASGASGARDFTFHFDYPGLGAPQALAWELSLRDAHHRVVRRWAGQGTLTGPALQHSVRWDGRGADGLPLAAGIYKATLRAAVLEATRAQALAATSGLGIDALARHSAASVDVQSWDLQVGVTPAPAMPAFAALGRGPSGGAHPPAAPATGALPYTVYYGNLHSQTSDSDGGGDLATCKDAQPPQRGAYGPQAAYPYAKSAGLDILMTSEHNHMFDGSTGTNANGDADAAVARYQAGLAAAADFSAANPGFLAIYGMEWGVISNGGHLNIFNSPQLFSWETNAGGQLFGDLATPKSDYAGLYATMHQHGLLGQFNHPASSGQFVINGTSLAYNADGDEVMALAEILNSSAFSANTSESESGLSNYEPAFNALLERGFHVAPSSDQDNHCANWGRSSTNRTGVLLPQGTPLSLASFLDALRARRVFATMDKTAQVVLTANGHVMGERFDNSGPLALGVGYASTSGHAAATVQIFTGVPGSNGSVSTLASTGAVSVTPASGAHFYYAKVTQDDGKILWSAPVWVNQGTGGGSSDTTPPTATASESGSAGTVAFSATASDDVGVTRVDFLVDGVLKGSAPGAPYTLAFDSTTLTNASHALVARAVDAAGNAGSSPAFAFSVNNAAGALHESESNGNLAAANVVGAATSITGTMGNSTDKDYFALALGAGQGLQVDMTGPAGKDYDLYLVDASGQVLASSDGNTCTERLSYVNDGAAATVYVEVVSYSGSSTTQPYTLTLSHP